MKLELAFATACCCNHLNSNVSRPCSYTLNSGSSGWWYTYPSEKYEFVSWDYYSQLNGNIKLMFQTTNQPWIFLRHMFTWVKWPKRDDIFTTLCVTSVATDATLSTTIQHHLLNLPKKYGVVSSKRTPKTLALSLCFLYLPQDHAMLRQSHRHL